MIHIDARGMRCPWPALRAARAMRDGAAFSIAADDPQAAGELLALAEARGWRVTDRGHGFSFAPPDDGPP